MHQGTAKVMHLQEVRAARAEEGSTELNSALRALKLIARARDTALIFPNARGILERLAAHLTAEARHPSGRPMLFVSLQTGFLWLDLKRARARHPTAVAVFRSLVAGLLHPLPLLLEHDVHNRRGERWDPLGPLPLAHWRHRHGPMSHAPGAQARYPHLVPTGDTQRAMIAHRILTTADIVALGGDLNTVLAEARADGC